MIEAYPLSWPIGWPRTKHPSRSRFDCTFAASRDGIINEIRLLGGKNLIISTNNELKRDGYPYANQKQPNERGVAVYFEYKGQSMAFACDRWDKIEHNLQGIYKTISAIRGIERWGVSDMIERSFNGFKALPETSSSTNGKPWFEILGIPSTSTQDEIKKAFRSKAKKLHPDMYKQASSPDEFVQLRKAYDYAMKITMDCCV